MDWQIRDDLPIYSQIMYQLELAIASGALSPGERLPSARDMAMDAGVNPNTVQRAMLELEREGIVYTQRTAGRFVTEDEEIVSSLRMSLARERTQEYLDAMEKLGFGRGEMLELLSEFNKEDSADGNI